MQAISAAHAPHYVWGLNCDGWHLVQNEEMSVIQERVPAGGRETMHYHERSRQFFYILEGEGQMQLDDETASLRVGEGLEIRPGVKHRFENKSGANVVFLVVSVPRSHGDRIDVE